MQNVASISMENKIRIYDRNRKYAQSISWGDVADLFL